MNGELGQGVGHSHGGGGQGAEKAGTGRTTHMDAEITEYERRATEGNRDSSGKTLKESQVFADHSKCAV